MRFIRKHKPTPALIISLIALSVALGGTAYAAVSIPKNSIGTKQLKNKAVTQAKLANGSVRSTKIKNGAVTASKLSSSAASAFLGAADVRADGAASSEPIADFTSSTFTPIVSKTFTAPESGYALIIGTLSTEGDCADGPTGRLFYTLALGGTVLAADDEHEADSSCGSDVPGASGAVTDVVPVSAGTHTVSLDAQESAGDSDYIEDEEISVLFVPNGSGPSIPYARRSETKRPQNGNVR